MKQSISFETFLSILQIRFFTWRKGELVGTDEFGNRYFRERKKVKGRRERRWVLYNGEPEATKVPPEWHGWLHHTHKEPLAQGSPFHKSWQKQHTPNRSGTIEAYRQPGHLLEGGHRPKASGDYESWVPN